jgi:hypothetical protein
MGPLRLTPKIKLEIPQATVIPADIPSEPLSGSACSEDGPPARAIHEQTHLFAKSSNVKGRYAK